MQWIGWSLLVAGGWSVSTQADLVFDAQAELEDEDRVLVEQEEIQKSPSYRSKARLALKKRKRYSNASSDDFENVSRTELLRRQRMRTELQNEDVLQMRLEELRLRDEERRKKELVALQLEAESQTAPAAAPVQTVQVRNHVVDHSGASDQISVSQASTDDFDDFEEDLKISIVPHAGLMELSDDGVTQTEGKFSTGARIMLELTPQVAVEFGYSFSEFSVSLPTNNVFLRNTIGTVQSMELNQNLFEAGVKYRLLRRRVRPFVAVGLGYSKSFLNYDEDFLNRFNISGQQSTDYETSAFLGYIGVGLDVRVTRTLSFGLSGRYYNTFSTREEQNFEGFTAFGSGLGFGSATPFNNGLNSVNSEKSIAGRSLKDSNFYSVSGSFSFTF